MIKIDLQKNNIAENQLIKIADLFLRGLVVAYPTDTIYGLGCLAENKKAIDKISKIKKRIDTKCYIMLMKNFCMVHDYCLVSKKQNEYLRTVWVSKSMDLNHPENLSNKEAVTVILKSRGLLKHLENKDGNLAVRIPKNQFLLNLLKKINKPIISTSLNISGQPTLTEVDNLEKNLANNFPDAVINIGVLKNKKPSRLIDITNMDDIKILR